MEVPVQVLLSEKSLEVVISLMDCQDRLHLFVEFSLGRLLSRGFTPEPGNDSGAIFNRSVVAEVLSIALHEEPLAFPIQHFVRDPSH